MCLCTLKFTSLEQQMDNEVHIDNDQKIICCTLEGELDIEKSISISKDIRNKASELDFNIFYDAQKLYVTDSILPADDFTTTLFTLREKLSSILEISSQRNVRVAFLYEPGEHDDYWSFYERVAINRGLALKIFTTKEEAMKWLAD